MDKNTTQHKSEFQVSVVMPVHNGAEFIQKAIESVLIQEVSLELIVIDDGSTDKTAEIVKYMSDNIDQVKQSIDVESYMFPLKTADPEKIETELKKQKLAKLVAEAEEKEQEAGFGQSGQSDRAKKRHAKALKEQLEESMPAIATEEITEAVEKYNARQKAEREKRFTQITEKLNSTYKVIKYVHNEHNIGAAESRNKGVMMASAPWIAFLDADDWWMAGKLRAQVKTLENSKQVLCCTARILMNEKGEPLNRRIPVKSQITYYELLKHNSINCSSVLVKTDVMKAFPMSHEDSHEDYICWLQIVKKYGGACGLKSAYLCYRMVKGSKSGNKLKSAKMTFRVYRYMGFNLFKSCMLFISYAAHGVQKYGLHVKTKE